MATYDTFHHCSKILQQKITEVKTGAQETVYMISNCLVRNPREKLTGTLHRSYIQVT